MNESFKKWFGITGAGLFVIIAANGMNFVEVLKALPALASAWAAGLPLGLWSMFLANMVGIVAYLVAEKALADDRPGRRASETIAILVVIGVAQAQLWVGEGSTSQRLNALWLGIVFGYMAPYVARRLAAVYTSATRHKGPTP